MEVPDREMLRLHVEAVWDVRLPALEQAEVTLLPGSARPDWRLYVAEQGGARIMIWCDRLAQTERAELLVRLEQLLALPENATLQSDVSREVALRLAVPPTIDLPDAQRVARLLDDDDYDMLEIFWPGEAAKLLRPEPRPLLGVVEAGRLLSLAHSSRRTGAACELGIDTLREARRQGYALAATVAWSAAVRAEGLIPIYSAFAENIASLRLAAAAGYREFARAIMLA